MGLAMCDPPRSWGGVPETKQEVTKLTWRHELKSIVSHPVEKILCYGKGRSYGDVCLNDGERLLVTRGLDRLISFDRNSGILRCEAGVTLENILKVAVPSGWFLPVTPGTKFVTIGGAVANDVHGKNHHRAGTFGRGVLAFELQRSSGECFICSPKENPELYQATIAGLGLTGLISWVEIQLKPISSALITMESIRFSSLEEFEQLSRESDRSFEYTVAWLDCVAAGRRFGRGLFMRGNHYKSDPSSLPINVKHNHLFSMPWYLPEWVLNKYSIKLFNKAYYHKQFQDRVSANVSYDSFFYPLDAVGGWNKIYGKRGLVQFQCIVPEMHQMRKILEIIVQTGRASFLAVLKEFGSITSPGMISFPRKGLTLCLDFPHQGAETIQLLRRLESMVNEYQGAIYPAKDICMSKASFRQFFPSWQKFSNYIDPGFSSSFWRRIS